MSTISCFLMSALHFILLSKCVCSYPHIHIHSHIHKHAQRAEAKYPVVRKSLKSLIKVYVTARNEKIRTLPLYFAYWNYQRNVIDCFYKTQPFIWHCVLFKLILHHLTEIHFKYCLEFRFLRLSTATRLYFCVCDVLHRIVYWYEAGCRTIFQLWWREWIDF